MMKYALLINESRDTLADRTSSNQQAYWGAWGAYVQAINAAGIVVAASGLQGPETATTVMFKGSTTSVQDGPFADSKDQLGGFFIIEVDNLDQALEWAKRCPISKGGAVQVRPVMPPMPAA